MDTTGAGGGVGGVGGGVLGGGKQQSRAWRRQSLKQYTRAPTQDAVEVSVFLGFVLFIYLPFFSSSSAIPLDPDPAGNLFFL